MDLGLEGKSAIVTGGSLGIGTAVALTLAREGCNVAINYRRHDTEAKEVVRQIEEMGRRGLAVKADVSSYQDAQNMVQNGGRGVRPSGHHGLQRRHQLGRRDLEDDRGAVGHGHQRQPQGLLQLQQGRRYGFQGSEERQDRQHLFHQRNARQVRPDELLRHPRAARLP